MVETNMTQLYGDIDRILQQFQDMEKTFFESKECIDNLNIQFPCEEMKLQKLYRDLSKMQNHISKQCISIQTAKILIENCKVKVFDELSFDFVKKTSKKSKNRSLPPAQQQQADALLQIIRSCQIPNS